MQPSSDLALCRVAQGKAAESLCQGGEVSFLSAERQWQAGQALGAADVCSLVTVICLLLPPFMAKNSPCQDGVSERLSLSQRGQRSQDPRRCGSAME